MTKIKINCNSKPHNNHAMMLTITNACKSKLHLLDVFVFCSIPSLFVCLLMQMSTYANVCVKSIFIGPRSIAGVPLSQAAPAYLITAHHLCAFLLYLARQQCGGFPKRKNLVMVVRREISRFTERS